MDTINDIVKIIQNNGRGRRFIVFVCGFGGAGKTTLCHELSAKLDRPAVVLETDWYAKYATVERRQRIKTATDSGDEDRIEQEVNPRNWYDWAALASALSCLKEDGNLEVRNGWCQRTGEKVLNLDVRVPGDSSECVILCDGIYLLHDEIRKIADLIVLLETPLPTCLERGANRDSHRSSQEYLAYKATLTAKYDVPYFEKFSSHAHIRVNECE